MCTQIQNKVKFVFLKGTVFEDLELVNSRGPSLINTWTSSELIVVHVPKWVHTSERVRFADK